MSATKEQLDQMKVLSDAIDTAIEAAKAHADAHGLEFEAAVCEGELAATYYGKGHSVRTRKLDAQGNEIEEDEDDDDYDWDNAFRPSVEEMGGWSSSFFER